MSQIISLRLIPWQYGGFTPMTEYEVLAPYAEKELSQE